MNFEHINFIENPLLDGGLRKKQIIKKSQKDKPLVTIITAVFNGEKYLEECIKSLHNQKYDNIEHIIIDGGSTDKTIEIIKKYENKIDYWCQKKDQGIYDAFNIGMKLAKGDYIGFLNSDDTYAEHAFVYLLNYLKNFQIKTLFLVLLKNTGGFYMVIDHIK